MADLYFDTEVGRQTSSALTTCVSNVRTELTNIENKVNTMVGSEWRGQSANLFQGEFQAWASQLKTTLATLEELKSKLDLEIAQWEQTASTFGGA
jgi:WXG100 family type VII secretion target